MRELFYAIKRFFIIASGDYTRYSDYPDFDKQFEIELAKVRARRRPRLVEDRADLLGQQGKEQG